MSTVGGYITSTLEFRAARRGRTLDEQIAADTRSGAQRKRDRDKREYIAPPEPKDSPSGSSGGKRR